MWDTSLCWLNDRFLLVFKGKRQPAKLKAAVRSRTISLEGENAVWPPPIGSEKLRHCVYDTKNIVLKIRSILYSS